MFWEMLRVLRYLQENQKTSPTYILENVRLLGNSRSRVVTSMHQVKAWLGPTVLLDAASVGSLAHRPRLWWTNLLPPEVLGRAYDQIVRPSELKVDDILDAGRQSQAVRHDDRSPLAVVNKVGQPRQALPTFVSFPASHAFCEGGPGLVWDEKLQRLTEPSADERERAMGFPTGTTHAASITEAARRQVLGQAMDLNCLTWIVALGMAEQRRMLAMGVSTGLPSMCSLPSGTSEARAGGIKVEERYPWTSWDVMKEVVAQATDVAASGSSFFNEVSQVAS
jgi:hypothetical protein